MTRFVLSKRRLPKAMPWLLRALAVLIALELSASLPFVAELTNPADCCDCCERSPAPGGEGLTNVKKSGSCGDCADGCAPCCTSGSPRALAVAPGFAPSVLVPSDETPNTRRRDFGPAGPEPPPLFRPPKPARVA